MGDSWTDGDYEKGIIEDPQIRELFTNELIALREAFEVCFLSLFLFFSFVSEGLT